MTIQEQLHDAVQHLGKVTGDPSAWMQGLTPADIALVGMAMAPEAEAAAVLVKIRANHPGLFDPNTGAPLSPLPSTPAPDMAEEQQGAGAAAIKKAEGDLAQQNSVTAQLDLHVISAILNAHTKNEQGNTQLDRLQSEIADAVRTRTDLDTPAGARDFQRYLIGKLREIGAVVQTASLDDTSKAALASAWTALYEASKTTSAAPGDSNPSPAATAPIANVPTPEVLPPYGAELGPDPLLDQLLADPLNAAAPMPDTAPAGATAPAAFSSPTATPPMSTAMPGLPMAGGGLPGIGPPSAGAGFPRGDESSPNAFRDGGGVTLEELLADTDPPALEDEAERTAADKAEDADIDKGIDKADTDAPPDPVPESAQVRLPNGELINAPTPQLAKVITTALGGTPVGEAFHQHGLTIPPPGTAVTDPVDPTKVGTGDVGMFTDRQALALDRTRALLGGQIQPLASVSGPSFLGWLHPPDADSTAPSSTSPEVPEKPDYPPPTRPASTAATGN